VNPLLEGAVFGTESVGGNFCGDRRDAGENVVTVHPPRQPGLELRLAAKFVHQVAVVVEDGAIGDDVRRATSGVEFGDDLCVQNPELAFDGGRGIDGKRGLTRDFGDELDVATGFLQQRTEFVGKSRFANAVRADKCKFQMSSRVAATSFLTQFQRIREPRRAQARGCFRPIQRIESSLIRGRFFKREYKTMRAVIQRATRGRVTVDGATIGETGPGLVVLVAVGAEDSAATAAEMAEKIFNLRIFNDEAGKMNRSLAETGGEVLAVSQFTLYGDARGQRRPSFIDAAPAELGKELYGKFVKALRELGVRVETGMFQTHMSVEIVNDGPVTILLDSQKLF
jgi:D-aminoacyl-tRNA deacylase